MKRYLFYTAIAATTLMSVGSCSSDDDLANGKSNGKTAIVSFSLKTPNLTRAYGDGSKAKKLRYGVYSVSRNDQGVAEYQLINDLSRTTYTNGTTSDFTLDANSKYSETIDIALSRGNEYAIVMWADAGNDENGEAITPYTVDFTQRTVSYTKTSNNDTEVYVDNNTDNNDAFYFATTFTVNGDEVIDAPLKRPFAQVNFGTDDYEASSKANFAPDHTSITMTNMPTKMNLLDGTTSGNCTVFCDTAALPANDEVFPVKKETDADGTSSYKYMSMNYVLAPDYNVTSDVTINYGKTNASGKVIAYPNNTKTVPNVPIARNYRTNIYGSLLVGRTQIKAVLDTEFDEPANNIDVKTQAEFENALATAPANSQIDLAANTTFTMLNMPTNNKIVINGASDGTSQLIVGREGISNGVTIQNVTLSSPVNTRTASTDNALLVVSGTPSIKLINVKFKLSPNNRTAIYANENTYLSLYNINFDGDLDYAIYSEGKYVGISASTFGKNITYAFNSSGNNTELRAYGCTFRGRLSGWQKKGYFGGCTFRYGNKSYPGAVCYGDTEFNNCRFDKFGTKAYNADGTYNKQPADGELYKYDYFVSAGKDDINITFDNNCKYTDRTALVAKDIFIFAAGVNPTTATSLTVAGTTYTSFDGFIKATE